MDSILRWIVYVVIAALVIWNVHVFAPQPHFLPQGIVLPTSADGSGNPIAIIRLQSHDLSSNRAIIQKAKQLALTVGASGIEIRQDNVNDDQDPDGLNAETLVAAAVRGGAQ